MIKINNKIPMIIDFVKCLVVEKSFKINFLKSDIDETY
jgi:hypothetical protein